MRLSGGRGQAQGALVTDTRRGGGGGGQTRESPDFRFPEVGISQYVFYQTVTMPDFRSSEVGISELRAFLQFSEIQLVSKYSICFFLLG